MPDGSRVEIIMTHMMTAGNPRWSPLIKMERERKVAVTESLLKGKEKIIKAKKEIKERNVKRKTIRKEKEKTKENVKIEEKDIKIDGTDPPAQGTTRDSLHVHQLTAHQGRRKISTNSVFSSRRESDTKKMQLVRSFI